MFFSFISLNFFDENEGNDKISVDLLIFLNFLLSFFMFKEFVNKIVKVTFFFLKNLISIKKKKIYIGDLAASYEIINSRSKKKFLVEFDKVWVHGFLHLVGYDHVKNIDYYKMLKIEKKILNILS